MKAATWPLADPATARLLLIDTAAGTTTRHAARDLPQWLVAGDLLIVNDAATLPGSFAARATGGEPVELRLVRSLPDEQWHALLFGAGDWHQDTDDRPLPPDLAVGDTLVLADGLVASIVALAPESRRLVTVRFNRQGADFWQALYRQGRPIQYRHLDGALALWDVQTRYAGRPWAIEMPSAGLPLTWDLLLALRRKGVQVASLTHAAGLSATGDPALDATLPWPEHYDLPAATVQAIIQAKHEGRRTIAAGTSVVRALEGVFAQHGSLVPGEGDTAYRLGTGTPLRVVNGLLTGIHEPSASHYRLLQAFAPVALLQQAYDEADAAGFQGHEFGDVCLILAG